VTETNASKQAGNRKIETSGDEIGAAKIKPAPEGAGQVEK
jgi:hypothetical protein